MNKIFTLPLALSLAALTFASSSASAARAPERPERSRAENGARRRPANRRKSAQAQEATYTCPMHKDVHTKSPGECPKCKMELELEEKPGKAKSE